jgi:hypothetical protein
MKIDILCLEGEPLDDVRENLHWVKYVAEHDRPISRELILEAQRQSTGRVDLYPTLEPEPEPLPAISNKGMPFHPFPTHAFPHTRTTMLFEHEDDAILWQMKFMSQ